MSGSEYGRCALLLARASGTQKRLLFLAAIGRLLYFQIKAIQKIS